MTADTGSTSRARWPRRIAWAGGGLLVALAVFVALSEWAGWPFLAGPMQSQLGKMLDRQVMFIAAPASQSAASAASAASDAPRSVEMTADHEAGGVEIHLVGGIDIRADRILIAAPEWSDGPPLLDAGRARLKLRYSDLWRAYRGDRLVVRLIAADRLDVALERQADGRASWQFGQQDEQQKERNQLPVVEELLVADGRLELDDAMLDSRVSASYWLRDGSGQLDGRGKPGIKVDSPTAGSGAPATGLQVKADGRYRSLPFKLSASSSGVLFLAEADASETKAPVEVDATVGYASFRFDGIVRGLASLSEVNGSFSLAGRSLAAVGDVIGVTLPTTPAFKTNGVLAKAGEVWNVKVDAARIGNSRLNAALRYDRAAQPPLLEGRVGGSRLLLQDLGPAVGTRAEVDVAEPRQPARTTAPGRVLPAREFDLPSLRAMDANVVLAFDELDLGTPRLQPLKPMRAHLVLDDAVLKIEDIDARTSSGSLAGKLRLDGRKDVAQWRADLNWRNILLQQWLKLERAEGSVPYLSGRLDGQTELSGSGRSTAEILGSLDGRFRSHIRDGTVSHLLVEGAGVDIAQALGVWIKGDASLQMSCAMADLKVSKGLMRPEVFVIDTRDSIVWIDGSISLVDESLDLRAVTSPKDFSLLSLRTPILVKGTMASPSVSLAPKPLAGKVIAAGLLSMLNPLAALIPLVDTGAPADKGAGCAELAAQSDQLRRAAKPS